MLKLGRTKTDFMSAYFVCKVGHGPQMGNVMEKFEILFKLEKTLHTFEFRSNAAKLAGLLSPDFFEYGSSGSL
jgi:hypothetical protein